MAEMYSRADMPQGSRLYSGGGHRPQLHYGSIINRRAQLPAAMEGNMPYPWNVDKSTLTPDQLARYNKNHREMFAAPPRPANFVGPGGSATPATTAIAPDRTSQLPPGPGTPEPTTPTTLQHTSPFTQASSSQGSRLANWQASHGGPAVSGSRKFGTPSQRPPQPRPGNMGSGKGMMGGQGSTPPNVNFNLQNFRPPQIPIGNM